MDLTKYKNQVNSLKQCIINVELAQVNYRSAAEAVSYGEKGAEERLKQAKEQLESTERTLKSQSRIICLQNEEVCHES